MNQTSKIILAVIIITLLVGSGVYAWQKADQQAKEESIQQEITDSQRQVVQKEVSQETNDTTEQPSNPTDETANWEIYRNSNYGFEFAYPHNSSIETKEDSYSTYIRLQNYSKTEDRLGLADGEYYLEIHIVDQQKGHIPTTACIDSVVEAKKVDMGVVSGYRGFGQDGGDAGGIRFALCAERPGVNFYIQGTENDENAPLVKPILDSFKFTK